MRALCHVGTVALHSLLSLLTYTPLWSRELRSRELNCHANCRPSQASARACIARSPATHRRPAADAALRRALCVRGALVLGAQQLASSLALVYRQAWSYYARTKRVRHEPLPVEYCNQNMATAAGAWAGLLWGRGSAVLEQEHC